MNCGAQKNVTLPYECLGMTDSHCDNIGAEWERTVAIYDVDYNVIRIYNWSYDIMSL